MTAKAGTPIRAKMKPWIAPATVPVRIARTRASISFMPCVMFSTANVAPATPLTEPTDRSISPSSRTKTMPTAIMPVPTMATDMSEKLLKGEEVAVQAGEDGPDDQQADHHGDGAEVTRLHLPLELVPVAHQALFAHQQPGSTAVTALAAASGFATECSSAVGVEVFSVLTS